VIIRSFFIVILHGGRFPDLSQNRTAGTFHLCWKAHALRLFAPFERRMEKIANSGPDDARPGWSVRYGYARFGIRPG
jgi:hypothetical protein